MPLKKGNTKKVVSENITEFHEGKTYRRTARKFGKKTADKQAVAAALNSARKSDKQRRAKKSTRSGFWG